MAKPSKRQASSDEAMSNGSSSSEEEEQTNEQINEEEDEEELEAVARSAGSDEDEAADDSDNDASPVENGEEEVNFEFRFSISVFISVNFTRISVGFLIFNFQFPVPSLDYFIRRLDWVGFDKIFSVILFTRKFEERETGELSIWWHILSIGSCFYFWNFFLFFDAVHYCYLFQQDGSNDGQDDKTDISRREKARLREMQQMKKQKIQDMLDAQNAAIDADMVCEKSMDTLEIWCRSWFSV